MALTRPYDVELTDDPAAFLAVAEPVLAADPVITTVVSTVTSRYRDERAAGVPPPADRPEWWAVVRDPDGAIAGLAMRTARTPPHPMFVLPMPGDAALALARAVHERGESVGALNGSLPAAEVCAAELARLQGDQVEVAQHTRLRANPPAFGVARIYQAIGYRPVVEQVNLRIVGMMAGPWHNRGMAKVRLSTTVDPELLARARELRPHQSDASLVERALRALLDQHRAAQIDAAYAAAYAERPLDVPDEWGDLASFSEAIGRQR